MGIHEIIGNLEDRLTHSFNNLNLEIISRLNKTVNVSISFDKTFQNRPIIGRISYMVPEYYGEDMEGVLLDFSAKFTPFYLDSPKISDANNKNVLYISCDIDNITNEDFYREIVLKDNPNLESDINQLMIDLEIFIMSKADLIVHIINDLYPLPLVKTH